MGFISVLRPKTEHDFGLICITAHNISKAVEFYQHASIENLIKFRTNSSCFFPSTNVWVHRFKSTPKLLHNSVEILVCVGDIAIPWHTAYRPKRNVEMKNQERIQLNAVVFRIFHNKSAHITMTSAASMRIMCSLRAVPAWNFLIPVHIISIRYCVCNTMPVAVIWALMCVVCGWIADSMRSHCSRFPWWIDPSLHHSIFASDTVFPLHSLWSCSGTAQSSFIFRCLIICQMVNFICDSVWVASAFVTRSTESTRCHYGKSQSCK